MKIIYLLILIFLSACFDKELATPEIIKQELEDVPDFVIASPVVNFYDSTRVKAVLSADTAMSYKKFQYTIMYNNVHIDFYQKQTNIIETYMDSDSAKIDESNNNMFAFNNVYVWSEKSKTSLNTDFLEWNQEKGMLFSNKYVKINSPVEIIEGYGMESNQDLTNYKIFKVKGVITK